MAGVLWFSRGKNKEKYYLALHEAQQTMRSSASDWQHWVQQFEMIKPFGAIESGQQTLARLASHVEND